MRKLILAACSALALGGCVTAEEMAAQDDHDCRSYGAGPGSSAYFQCRMVKDDRHTANAAAQAQVAQEMGTAMMIAGASMMQQ